MSLSLSLSAAFFCRGRAVGLAPAAALAFAREAAAALGCGGARVDCERMGRSLEELPGDGLLGGEPTLAVGVAGLAGWREGSRAVLERSTGLEDGPGGLEGVRWDVDRSSAGETAEGGVGAGRYAVGAGEEKADWDWGFFGGGGGERCGALGTIHRQ